MRLLRAVVLACYGILTLAATVPHSHELGAREAARPRAAAQVPSLVDLAGASSDGSGGGRQSPCSLCAWGRSMARPAATATLEDAGPTVRSPLRTAELVPHSAPNSCSVLLRAPPAV